MFYTRRNPQERSWSFEKLMPRLEPRHVMILRWLLPIILTIGISLFIIENYWNMMSRYRGADTVSIYFGILLAILLSLLPPLLCVVQNVSRRRQLSKLESLKPLSLTKTSAYRLAVNWVDSIRLVVDTDYALPIFLFFFVNFIGFLALFAAYSRPLLFDTASVLLGGLFDRSDVTKLELYQLQTFCVVAMAFMGSYVYALGRILDRINNNDLYPISLYYYIVRTVIACTAASILRHTLTVFGDGIDQMVPGASTSGAAPMLLLLGFAVGFAPDLFILAMTRKAFQAIKVWGTRADPGEGTRPTSLPLLMIDDLTREKIDRLNELGIDSAQMLAGQNPFLLLPRLPYELGTLVDWVAQAQLYVLVKDSGMQTLRRRYIRDIFDFHIRLQNEPGCGDICTALGLSAGTGRSLLQQLNEDPSYLRLKQIRDELRPEAPALVFVATG